MYFPYSTHKTLARAEAALEDYFASGEVSEAEQPYIASSKRRAPEGHERTVYSVMFPG